MHTQVFLNFFSLGCNTKRRDRVFEVLCRPSPRGRCPVWLLNGASMSSRALLNKPERESRRRAETHGNILQDLRKFLNSGIGGPRLLDTSLDGVSTAPGHESHLGECDPASLPANCPLGDPSGQQTRTRCRTVPHVAPLPPQAWCNASTR